MFKNLSIPKKFYIINFLQLLTTELTGTCLILYLLSKNLSLYHCNILMIVFYLTIFVCEIPTGIIADLYGRKISVVLGFLLYTISLIIFITSNSFIMFVLSQIISGIAITLESGALEAWAIESLDIYNDSTSINELFSKSYSYSYLAGILCGFISAYFANFNLSLPWFISIVAGIITTVFCYVYMDEHYFNKKTNNTIKDSYSSMKSILKESINIGIKNKSIFTLIFIASIIQFANSSGNTFQQARFVGLFGGEIWIMAWVKAFYSIFMFLGSRFVKYLSDRNINEKNILSICFLIIGIFQALSGYFNTFLSVLILFLIYEFGRGMYGPSYSSFINKKIPNESRATILSFSSQMSQIGMILGLLITGIIGKNFNNIEANQLPIRISWILCGIIAISASYINNKFIKSSSEKEENCINTN